MKKNSQYGMTLSEVLIVSTLIIVLVTAFLAGINIKGQLAKGRDAKRKTDLTMLKTKLEDYYNDKGVYPVTLGCGDSFQPYLSKIPCEAKNTSYAYSTTGQSYRIYTTLEYKADLTIAKAGCSSGCGPGNKYNWGVTSPNVGL